MVSKPNAPGGCAFLRERPRRRILLEGCTQPPHALLGDADPGEQEELMVRRGTHEPSEAGNRLSVAEQRSHLCRRKTPVLGRDKLDSERRAAREGDPLATGPRQACRLEPGRDRTLVVGPYEHVQVTALRRQRADHQYRTDGRVFDQGNDGFSRIVHRPIYSPMSPSNHARVLVAADDYYASLATIRGLRAAGYEPWVATAHCATYAAHSRAAAGVVLVPWPSAGADAFVRSLADAAADLRAAAVVPACESALLGLSGRASFFPEGVAVGTSDAATVARATDKAEVGRVAAAAGLAVPSTVEVRRADLSAQIADLRFPAIVKPARSVGDDRNHPTARPRTRLVETADELRDAVYDGIRWLVQPYIEGELAAVAGVAWNGDLVCAVHQVARRIYPRLGASAYAETVARDTALEKRLAQLVGELGWSGIFEAQLIRNGRGSYLIDFNPRPYGSLALAIRAGANLPGIWVDLLLGRRPESVSYRTGVHFRSEPREARVVLDALRRGRIREALAPLVPRRRTAHAIFSLRDPAPLLFLVARGVRALRRT
jgi:predicted ATP-grasp superfamily ATP-dependent carboligase